MKRLIIMVLVVVILTLLTGCPWKYLPVKPGTVPPFITNEWR